MRGVKNSYKETHKILNGIEYKLCSDCGNWFPMTKEYYYTNKASPDGYYPYCKEDTKKRSAKWQKENIDKKRASDIKHNTKPERKQGMRIASQKYRETGGYINWQHNNKEKISEYNKDKLLKRTHDISDEEWENCKNYFNYRCAYCNLPIEEHYIKYAGKLKWTDFHQEHVEHNGENDLSNCVPSCKTCNSQKNESSLEERYKEDNLMCGVYSLDRLLKIYRWLNGDFEKIQRNIDFN